MASIALSTGNLLGEVKQALTSDKGIAAVQGSTLVDDDYFLDRLVTNITKRVLDGTLKSEVFAKEETIDDADIISFID